MKLFLLLATWLCSVFLLCPIPSFASANNIGIEFKNSALTKIFESALDHYVTDKEQAKLQIDAGKIDQVIKKEFFTTNPVIQKIQQYVLMDLNKDIHYTVKWSPLTIHGNISNKKISVNAVDKNHIKLAIMLEFDQFDLRGNSIEVFEKGVNYKSKRMEGLYGKFEKFKIHLHEGKKLKVVAFLNIVIENGITSVVFDSLHTNMKKAISVSEREIYDQYDLNERTQFSSNFKNFIMPPPVLAINGEEFEIDVSRIKKVILEEKRFLTEKLIATAGDFLAKDIAGLVNSKILGNISKLSSSFKLIDFYDEYAVCLEPESTNMMDEMLALMKSWIYQTSFTLDYYMAKTPGEKDLELSFDSEMHLNEKLWGVGPYIHNSTIPLGDLEFSSPNALDLSPDYDIAIGISEPQFNAALNIIQQQGVFQAVFDQFVSVPGVRFNGLNLHFVNLKNGYSSDSAIDVVVQLEVNFSQLDTSSKRTGWRKWYEETMSWTKNQFASILESGKVYFPLQMRFYPKIVERDNGVFIQLNAIGPLNFNGIKNHYNYPYKDMYSIVEEGIIEQIKNEINPHLSSLPEIDITSYLNLSGIQVTPVEVFTKNSGHLVLRVKIDDIDLNSIKEKEL